MSISRIGHGYDVHAFTDGGGFVLGGVFISCDKAVIAHSDGDVLIHALCDALLGALGRGDIGRLFPDNDARNQDRDSREFLRAIKQLLDHIDAMKEILARALDCAPATINIKATTTERLGYIGREEGIAAEAVVMLEADQ
jgi:2-C-methyl-D-erythritol 2,4-cyclodiphosphate synthase